MLGGDADGADDTLGTRPLLDATLLGVFAARIREGGKLAVLGPTSRSLMRGLLVHGLTIGGRGTLRDMPRGTRAGLVVVAAIEEVDAIPAPRLRSILDRVRTAVEPSGVLLLALHEGQRGRPASVDARAALDRVSEALRALGLRIELRIERCACADRPERWAGVVMAARRCGASTGNADVAHAVRRLSPSV
jgi:hypothetical protein